MINSVGSSVGTSLAGLNNAAKRIQVAANNIANQSPAPIQVGAPNIDQATELVNLKIASYDYKANLKAIQIQNNVEQMLLNIVS